MSGDQPTAVPAARSHLRATTTVAVLGPVRVEHAGAVVRVRPRERVVLAALVLRWPRTVSGEALIDDLWGSRPPRSARKSLQMHVVGLRRRVHVDLIATDPHGYRLTLGPDGIDVARFDELTSAAQARWQSGDHARCVESCDGALSEWRGQPYDELDTGAALAEQLRLREVHARTEDLRLEALLALGDHAGAALGALRLASIDPMREVRWVVLAEALYRSGRLAECRRALTQAERVLHEHARVGLGPRLREIQARLDLPP